MKQLRNFWKLVLHNSIKASMFDSFSINSWTHFLEKTCENSSYSTTNHCTSFTESFKLTFSAHLTFFCSILLSVDQLFILSFRVLFANSHRIYFLPERPCSAWVLASERAIETRKREIINKKYSLSSKADVTFHRISWSIIRSSEWMISEFDAMTMAQELKNSKTASSSERSQENQDD